MQKCHSKVLKTSLCSHRGVQVICLLILYLLLAECLPLEAHRGLYTLSLFVKDLLIWALPLTVGFFIAHTISSFQKKAPLFILVLLLFEGLSNMSSAWFSWLCGQAAEGFLPQLALPPSDQTTFSALWRLPFSKPTWWTSEKGVFAGLAVGCLAALYPCARLQRIIECGERLAQWTLTKVFSRLIPLFVLGFVASMYQTQLLQHVATRYNVLVLWLVAALFVYICLLFLIGNSWSVPRAIQAIRNLLPAGGLAFTSGCSLSTMPWTIECTSKNLRDPSFAQAVIPATTNIQQIGDCITNSFLCFLLYTQFFGHTPTLATWANFSLYFTLARYATAAVLGGAIFIMIPVYEAFLAFTPEMLAIILAFNVVLDPIVTSSNVIANGALCQIFERVWNRFMVRRENGA